MLDTLMSKIALTMAVIVIIGVILAVFNVQLDRFREEDIQVTCDNLQVRVDDVSSINAETKMNISYGEAISDQVFFLPQTLNGDPYTMEIYTTGVRIIQDEFGGQASFQHSVHLFYPGDILDATETSLASLDGLFDILSIESGEDFVIERRHFPSSGHQTFIYSQDFVTGQENVRRYAEAIDGFVTSGPLETTFTWHDDVSFIPNFIIVQSGGYTGVSQIHVNHTYDPAKADVVGVGPVGMDRFKQIDAEHNGRIDVSANTAFVLLRTYIEIEITVPTTAPGGETVRVLEFVHGFIYM